MNVSGIKFFKPSGNFMLKKPLNIAPVNEASSNATLVNKCSEIIKPLPDIQSSKIEKTLLEQNGLSQKEICEIREIASGKRDSILMPYYTFVGSDTSN